MADKKQAAPLPACETCGVRGACLAAAIRREALARPECNDPRPRRPSQPKGVRA